MNFIKPLICITVIIAIMLTFGSCGTKKQKARASLGSSAVTAVDGDGAVGDESGDPFDNEIQITSGYSGQVATITRHRYEFYDYYQEKSRYNSMGSNAMRTYHPYYIGKYFEDFRQIKNYIIENSANGTEIVYQCKLLADGTRKYVDGSAKEITDQKIISFFENHDIISAIRVNNELGDRTFFADFFVPSFVNDLDYMITMSAVFCNTISEEQLMASDNTEYVKKVEDGWCYYVYKNNFAKIRVVN